MTDMEKVETDNIAVVQARALKKYCVDHEGCCGCVFDGYDSPKNWYLAGIADERNVWKVNHDDRA